MLVDDHRIVATAIGRILETFDDIEFVGHAATRAEAVSMIPALRPQILLLDLMLADCSGFEVARWVSSSCLEVRIVCFTSYVAPELVSDAVALETWGYIVKVEELEALPAALRAVAGGQMAFSQEAARIAHALRPDAYPRPPSPALTECDREVLRHLSSRMPLADVARQLGRQRTTIQTVWERVQEKLGIRPAEQRLYVPDRPRTPK
jgi:DNA-binding NarL/FixJ family response regulator